MAAPHHWRRRLWLAAGIVVIAAGALVAGLVVGHRPAGGPHRLATVPAPLHGQPPPQGTAFGASVNLLFNDGTFTPTAIAAQLRALGATGATFARSDALWEASEPRAPDDGTHHYDWLFDDTIAGDLAAAGLRWLPIVDYSAPWAQSVPGQDHSPPSSDADYAAYAQALAARYGAGGSFWSSHPTMPRLPVTTIEVWNEPDVSGGWYPSPDAGAYASLYQLTREAIDRVDPSSRVIVGGLVNPRAFLPAMVHADPGLVGHVDGVAIHPYGTPPVVLTRVSTARRALRALGMGDVPLYVTEFGWTVSPPGAINYATAAQRPAYLAQTLSELGHSDCGIAAASLYTWASTERDPANDQDWFGISPIGLPGDATADDAQAVRAFTAGLRTAAAPGAEGTSCAG